MSDLKGRIDRLREDIDNRAQAQERAAAGSFSARRRNEVSAAARFLAQLGAAGFWILDHLLKPVAGILAIPGGYLWRVYRGLWDRVVHVEDKFGNRLFSKTRAGILLATTLGFLWFVLVPLLGFAFDATLYTLTAKRDEIVYLTNSQEILPEENIHSVQGCHELPCDDENSVYFRIRASAFNEVWSLLSGRGLFYPDYVAAAVPLTLSECRITSYGIRLKFLMRGMDLYPDVLTATCAPLTGLSTQP